MKTLFQKVMASRFGGFLRYSSYSIIATALDMLISRFLYAYVQVPDLDLGFMTVSSLVFANTIGVTCGVLLHYFLASKTVFYARVGAMGIIIYVSTAILGLLIGNWAVSVSYGLLNAFLPETLSYWMGKLISELTPFLILYYVRKLLFSLLRNYQIRKAEKKAALTGREEN